MKTDLYERVSITAQDKIDNKYKFTNRLEDEHPLQKPMSFQYVEADTFRKHFFGFARTRITSIVRMQTRSDILANFYEPSPGRLLMHTLYADCVAQRMTTQQSLMNSLGVSAQKAGQLINRLIDTKVVTRYRHANDLRTHILVPSIEFFVTMEKHMAHFVVRSAYNTGRLPDSHLIASLIEFDKLRKQHFSTFMYNLTNFNIENYVKKVKNQDPEHSKTRLRLIKND